jgi:hypothetical protein
VSLRGAHTTRVSAVSFPHGGMHKLHDISFNLNLITRHDAPRPAEEARMADIIAFPTPTRAATPASPAVALRDAAAQLAAASAVLGHHRASLARQSDALAATRAALGALIAETHAVAALARAIEHALATGDHAAVTALQIRVNALRTPCVDRAAEAGD